MFRRFVLASSLSMFIGASLAPTVARAAEPAGLPAVAAATPLAAAIQPVLVPEVASVAIAAPSLNLSPVTRPHVGSNVGLGALYASTALMHILDVDSTLKALKRGAVEANPLMSGVVRNRTAFIATKAAIAAGSIYATSRIARHSKMGAVISSAAMNSAYLMIVRNNYAIANR